MVPYAVPGVRIDMTKAENLYIKAKQAPNNFTFASLLKLTKAAGFKLRKNSGGGHKGGSHQFIFRHPATGGVMNFQRGKPKSNAKPYQVKQLLNHIDEHNLLEGSKDV